MGNGQSGGKAAAAVAMVRQEQLQREQASDERLPKCGNAMSVFFVHFQELQRQLDEENAITAALTQLVRTTE